MKSVRLYWLSVVALACGTATGPDATGQVGDVYVSVSLEPTTVRRGEKFTARVVRKNLGSATVQHVSGAECPALFRVYKDGAWQGPQFPEIYWECRSIGTPFPLAPGDSQVQAFPVTAGGAPGDYEFRVLWLLTPTVPDLTATFTIR